MKGKGFGRNKVFGRVSRVKRINSLEALRGVAVMMVLFSHLGVMFYPAYYWGGVRIAL